MAEMSTGFIIQAASTAVVSRKWATISRGGNIAAVDLQQLQLLLLVIVFADVVFHGKAVRRIPRSFLVRALGHTKTKHYLVHSALESTLATAVLCSRLL